MVDWSQMVLECCKALACMSCNPWPVAGMAWQSPAALTAPTFWVPAQPSLAVRNTGCISTEAVNTSCKLASFSVQVACSRDTHSDSASLHAMPYNTCYMRAMSGPEGNKQTEMRLECFALMIQKRQFEPRFSLPAAGPSMISVPTLPPCQTHRCRMVQQCC